MPRKVIWGLCLFVFLFHIFMFFYGDKGQAQPPLGGQNQCKSDLNSYNIEMFQVASASCAARESEEACVYLGCAVLTRAPLIFSLPTNQRNTILPLAENIKDEFRVDTNHALTYNGFQGRGIETRDPRIFFKYACLEGEDSYSCKAYAELINLKLSKCPSNLTNYSESVVAILKTECTI